jgi:hypothetical protein
LWIEYPQPQSNTTSLLIPACSGGATLAIFISISLNH